MAAGPEKVHHLVLAPGALATAITPSPDPIHCSNRLFEWITAVIMVGIATTIAISPRAVASGGFHLLQNLGLTAEVLVLLFAIGGCVRIAALWANGRWQVCGPWFRFGCALAGAFLWAQMCLALIEWSDGAGYVSIGVPVYAGLALGELISCSRAARDGRHR
jgi:hypothetical protein